MFVSTTHSLPSWSSSLEFVCPSGLAYILHFLILLSVCSIPLSSLHSTNIKGNYISSFSPPAPPLVLIFHRDTNSLTLPFSLSKKTPKLRTPFLLSVYHSLFSSTSPVASFYFISIMWFLPLVLFPSAHASSLLYLFQLCVVYLHQLALSPMKIFEFSSFLGSHFDRMSSVSVSFFPWALGSP